MPLQVIMEIPLELMLTISQKLPWMFFPDIIPIGHPIFDIINSTNPEVKLHPSFTMFFPIFLHEKILFSFSNLGYIFCRLTFHVVGNLVFHI